MLIIFYLNFRKHISYSIISSVFSIVVYGQNTFSQHLIDSLTIKFRKDSAHVYRFKMIRPFAAIDNRNSFIKEGSVNVNGFQLGVIINEKHHVGYGFYNLQNNSKQNLTSKDPNNGTPLKRTLSLADTTLVYQYVIIDERFF